MSALRKKMIEDMQLRGFALRTQEAYLLAVRQLSIAAPSVPGIAALICTTKRSVDGVRILDLLGPQNLIESRQFLFPFWRERWRPLLKECQMIRGCVGGNCCHGLQEDGNGE